MLFLFKKQRKEEESMKRVFVVLMLAVSLVVLAACGSDEQFDLENETEFVVGLEAAYAPFNWSTPTENDFTYPLHAQNGVYVDGYDVVIAQQIADELGLTLVVKAIEWDGLILALLAGEIDMIIAGMSPTAERAETVAFSDEYFRSEQVMVVATDGDYADATAFIAELPVAQGMVASNSNLTIIQFTEGNGFVVSDEDVAVAVALRQEDINLLEAVNGVLASISIEQRNAIMQAALNRQPNA